MSALIPKSTALDDRLLRLVRNKIDHEDRYFGNMATVFESVLLSEMKTAKRYDDLTRQIRLYSDGETVGIRTALSTISNGMQNVQDHRRAQCHQLYDRVQALLRGYKEKCKRMKDEIEKYEKLIHTVVLKQAKADKLNVRETSKTSKQQAVKSELTTALQERDMGKRDLTHHTIEHERKKIEDLKKIFEDVLSSQMYFHAKALESLTEVYNGIKHISPVADLKELKLVKRSQHAGESISSPRDDARGRSQLPPHSPSYSTRSELYPESYSSKRFDPHIGDETYNSDGSEHTHHL
eukprot:m.57867 g.57867  ORF g.57867 m.57867 type:complete len:294 (+) comp11138_c0_seq3:272-1153(+)